MPTGLCIASSSDPSWLIHPSIMVTLAFSQFPEHVPSLIPQGPRTCCSTLLECLLSPWTRLDHPHSSALCSNTTPPAAPSYPFWKGQMSRYRLSSTTCLLFLVLIIVSALVLRHMIIWSLFLANYTVGSVGQVSSAFLIVVFSWPGSVTDMS